MRRYFLHVFTVLLFIRIFGTNSAFGQACGCAGSPLLGSLENPSTPKGSWDFGLNYEYNELNELVLETEELNDSNSRRNSQSLMLEASRGLTDRWSITALLSYIRHERESFSLEGYGTGSYLRTRGIGDAVLLLKYRILPQKFGLPFAASIGGGVKFPVGESGITDKNVFVAENMQPVTGSWDPIIWGYSSYAFDTPGYKKLFSVLSYRFTGENDRDYRFGNEFVGILGFSYKSGYKFDYHLTARYRSTLANKRNDWKIPNTGGTWLFIIPGININISNIFSIRLSGKIPVYRKLNGIQLTTRYTASLMMFYSILNLPSISP